MTVVFQLCLLTRLLTPSRLPPPSCVFTCPVGDVWGATQRVCRVNCAQCFASVLPASFLMELGTMVTRDGYESLSPQSVFSSAVYSLRKVRKQMLSKRTKGSKTSVTVLMQFVSCVPAEVGARLATHAGLCPLWGPFRPADTESGIPAWTTWVEELAQPGVPRAGGGSRAAPALSARFHGASERSGGRHAPAVSFQLTFVCTGRNTLTQVEPSPCGHRGPRCSQGWWLSPSLSCELSGFWRSRCRSQAARLFSSAASLLLGGAERARRGPWVLLPPALRHFFLSTWCPSRKRAFSALVVCGGLFTFLANPARPVPCFMRRTLSFTCPSPP